jgi:hypothetical protein
MVAALLGTALAISIGRASVATYVVEVEPLRQVVTADSEPHLEATVSAPAGLSPDHPESDLSAISIDLLSLRERWLTVYDYYIDDREPEPADDYAAVPGSRQKHLDPGHHRKSHVWRRHGSHWVTR